jgi:hypothetical protein
VFSNFLISANFFHVAEQKNPYYRVRKYKKGRIEIQPVLIQYPMKNHSESRMIC